MIDELHYPPGAEPEQKPADAPAPEGDKAPETPEGDKPEGEKPLAGDEPEVPQDKKPGDGQKLEEDPPAAPPEPIKKRSIYDDLKDTRKEKNEFKDIAITALKVAGVELKGDETPEQLRSLMEQHKPAKPPAPTDTPAPKDPPKDDLAAFAEEYGMDATGLSRLAEIIQKRTPAAHLSEEDKQALADLQGWRVEKQRSDEDAEVRSHSAIVQKDLGISDAAELTKVMNEVVRLSHTKGFHDKEVGYILWANREALSKMVSPKKPSFESGGKPPAPEPDTPTDFSSGKVTPEQAAKAMHDEAPRNTYEIRRPQ